MEFRSGVAAQGELAYAERDTSLSGQTNTVDADSGLVLPAFTVANSPVMVELFWPQVLNGTATQSVAVVIAHDNGSGAAVNTVIAETIVSSPTTFAASSARAVCRLWVPGTYRLKARHRVTAGSGLVGTTGKGVAYMRAWTV